MQKGSFGAGAGFERRTRRLTRLVGAAQRLLRAAGGASAVELGLVATPLVVLVIGVADFGIAVYQKMEVQLAAQAGAEYAGRHAWDVTAIKTAVTSATSLSSISASPPPSQSCGCPSGTSITAASCGTNCASGQQAGVYGYVSATAQYSMMFPYPGVANPMTLSAKATVRLQ
jgi:Flp pilus assembly protein TadG